MQKLILSLGAAVLAAASWAQSSPFISEFLINPTGTDEGLESIELTAPASFDYSSNGGWYFLSIEADGGNSNTGEIDNIIDLTGATAGTNGLLLIRDNLANVHFPAPDPLTAIIDRGAEMTPDLENGAQTWVLAHGTKPALKFDFDTNNDGVVDQTPPGLTIVDAVSYIAEAGTGYSFGGQLGGFDFGQCFGTGGITPFTPDAGYRVLDCDGDPAGWTVLDVFDTGGGGLGPWGVRASAGTYFQVGMEAFGIDYTVFTLDLGTRNIEFCEGGPIELAPISYTLGPQGSEEGANDVTKVTTSDDIRAVAFNTTVANNNIPSIRFTFFFTSPVTNGITELNASVELQSQFLNHERRVEFVNATNNNAFFQVALDVATAPNVDVTLTGSLTNAADIAAVVAGDGTVKTTARGRKVGVMPAQKHRLRVDMAKLVVSQ
ncbi:MAG: hypothetical protein HONBIEJF_01671 [Fimbriimonadaceae bacterium]|nr:hypothetical protein [Fimbriimonadaceae bacterium]